MTPFLKWPGGKRWFVARHADLLPTKFGCYVEPFLGGGSVFFHLRPSRAILSDTNPELIDVYRAVARRRNELDELLRRHRAKHGHRYYYRMRDAAPVGLAARAARTLYLNRTCFNGIYRVNLAGVFNVPKGCKTAVLLPTDDFGTAAGLLRRADLRVSDFETVINDMERGDFVYADPPYTVRHNSNEWACSGPLTLPLRIYAKPNRRR